MIRALDSENLVDGVFCSYEARIQGVECLLETARNVLENFDTSVLAVRHEYEQVSEQLRDNLARRMISLEGIRFAVNRQEHLGMRAGARPGWITAASSR